MRNLYSQENFEPGTLRYLEEINILFSDLWRTENRYHVIWYQRRGLPRTALVTNPWEGAVLARKKTSAGFDVRFRCAEYDAPPAMGESTPTGAWALWIGIAYGPDHVAAATGYANAAEAEAAITLFCASNGLPFPSHTVAGNSVLTAYWAVDRLIPKDIWEVSARKLNSMACRFGLRLKAGYSTDIKSLMLVPGTSRHDSSWPSVRLTSAAIAPIDACILVTSLLTDKARDCCKPQARLLCKERDDAHRDVLQTLSRESVSGKFPLRRVAPRVPQ